MQGAGLLRQNRVMQQSCSRARIRVTCARASARPAPARRSAKRAGRAGGRDPIQRARRFMTRATLPFGIPLIPLNPAESRIAFKFCPSWKAEPDRDTAEKCGLVSCSRSFYPCARRPRHVPDSFRVSGHPCVVQRPAGLAAGDARNKSARDPLIPLNPAESRIAFKFCPTWPGLPGLVPGIRPSTCCPASGGPGCWRCPEQVRA